MKQQTNMASGSASGTGGGGATSHLNKRSGAGGQRDTVSEADSQSKWPHDKFEEIQQQQQQQQQQTSYHHSQHYGAQSSSFNNNRGNKGPGSFNQGGNFNQSYQNQHHHHYHHHGGAHHHGHQSYGSQQQNYNQDRQDQSYHQESQSYEEYGRGQTASANNDDTLSQSSNSAAGTNQQQYGNYQNNYGYGNKRNNMNTGQNQGGFKKQYGTGGYQKNQNEEGSGYMPQMSGGSGYGNQMGNRTQQQMQQYPRNNDGNKMNQNYNNNMGGGMGGQNRINQRQGGYQKDGQQSQNYIGNKYSNQMGGNYGNKNQYGGQYGNQMDQQNQIRGGGSQGFKNFQSNINYGPNQNQYGMNNEGGQRRKSFKGDYQTGYRKDRQYYNNPSQEEGIEQQPFQHSHSMQPHTQIQDAIDTSQNNQSLTKHSQSDLFQKIQEDEGTSYQSAQEDANSQQHRQIFYQPGSGLGNRSQNPSSYAVDEDKQYKQYGQNGQHYNQSKRQLLYVLNLKLKDQQITIEVHEKQDIGEIVRQVISVNKLPKEMSEALQIYIQRKLEGVIPWQSVQMNGSPDIQSSLNYSVDKKDKRLNQNNQITINQQHQSSSIQAPLNSVSAPNQLSHLNPYVQNNHTSIEESNKAQLATANMAALQLGSQIGMPNMAGFPFGIRDNNFINAQNLNLFQASAPAYYGQNMSMLFPLFNSLNSAANNPNQTQDVIPIFLNPPPFPQSQTVSAAVSSTQVDMSNTVSTPGSSGQI